MPGHTPGHQAIYVATQSGTAIICGDAAMNVAVNVDKQVPPGFLDNMADTMSGLRKLQREKPETHSPQPMIRVSSANIQMALRRCRRFILERTQTDSIAC